MRVRSANQRVRQWHTGGVIVDASAAGPGSTALLLIPTKHCS
jgi:hypothetical protein